jgi:RNA polymerase sigma-70 factor, ECF subfamily
MKKSPNHSGRENIQRNEAELVRKAQAGDFNAFGRLIEQYRPKIYGLALRLSKNRQDAEDIFQDTFLKAIDNIRRFRGDSSFGTWLYVIALNIVRARYKNRDRKELLPLDSYLPEHTGHEGAEAELADWNDPLTRLAADELRDRLQAALDRLPLKYRMPFVLRYTQDMSVAEVASVLGLSTAAAKSRILRARLALQSFLHDLYIEGKTDGRVS